MHWLNLLSPAKAGKAKSLGAFLVLGAAMLKAGNAVAAFDLDLHKAGKAEHLGAFLVHGRQCLRHVMYKPFDHTCERMVSFKRDTSFGVWGC